MEKNRDGIPIKNVLWAWPYILDRKWMRMPLPWSSLVKGSFRYCSLFRGTIK